MTFDLAGLLAAGLLTFASPCVLPLVPIYLGLLGGASAADVRRGAGRATLVARAAAFSLGLGTVFVVLGLASTAAGRLLSEHRPALLASSGAVSIAFGLRFLGVLRLPFADRERRPWLGRVAPGGSLVAAYAFGGAFALGWTPCVGPVLGSVLTYTASAGPSPARGALYLGTYAAGLALPLVLAAAFAPRVLRVLDGLKRHLRKVEIATGLLLVGAGVLLASDRLMVLMPSGGSGRVAAAVTETPLPSPSAAALSAGDAACVATAAGAACGAHEEDWAPPTAAPAARRVRGPAVVELASRACPICRAMVPVIDDAERDCATKVVRLLVEEPEGADLARRHAVRAVPTFLVLDAQGAEVRRLVGQQPAAAVRDALRTVSPLLCGALPLDAGAGRAPGGS
jgi:cytochrome c-type biogenesis protein